MTDTGGKPASLADIVASATRAERTVTICVAGHLNTEYDRLEQQLQQLTRDDAMSGSLADGGEERRAIAERMEQISEEMRAHEHVFVVRALPAKQWSDLTLEHPAREGKQEFFNVETFPLSCVAASLVKINGEDVTVTVADLEPLWNDALNVGQRDELFNAAWEANTGRVSVPFSPLVSVTLGRTESK